MARRQKPADLDDELSPPLSISSDKVCFVILKARGFDAKDETTDPDTASNAADDGMIAVLENHRDDPVEHELKSMIWALTEDEQIDLVAIAWLGRDDNTLEDWPALRAEAGRAHSGRPGDTAKYLLGEPLLGDYLEEGLTILGRTCEDFEAGHL